MCDVKVSVICTVYNHERYLKKCLESLTMQKITYKYEIIVHDDASTDKSVEIIKEFQKKFPDIIKPIYQSENQYSKGNQPSAIAIQHACGEYIAICEGDDFWISENKLQMQVDYLETHKDYSMCVHATYYAHEDDSLFLDKFFQPYNHSCEITIREIMSGWKFATNSIVYRQSARKELSIPFRGNCLNGDYALSVYLALNGKVHYINELWSAYRAESIGSLNWIWRENLSKYIEAKNRYIEMLKRIDQYTNYKYSDVLRNNIEDAQFDICIICGDIKKAKNFKKRYQDLGKKRKFELWLHSYYPNIFRVYRKLVKEIKNAKDNI